MTIADLLARGWAIDGNQVLVYATLAELSAKQGEIVAFLESRGHVVEFG